MRHQKGFSPLIIVIIFLLLIGVGGYLYYSNTKSPQTKTNIFSSTTQQKSSEFSYDISDKKLLFSGGYADPSVVKLKDNTYIMYVNTFGNAGSANLIYTSKDGVTWEETSQKAPGSATARGFLTDDGVRIYYPTATPINPSDPESQILSAFSKDGLSFETEPGSRLRPTNGYTIEGPSVVKLSNGTLRMYFDEFPSESKQERNGGKIYGATSTDGLTWTRDTEASIESDETIERSPANWPQALRPFVLQRPSGGYVMFYNSHSKIFIAYSTDGYKWEKLGGLGIKGADIDAHYTKDGNIRIYFGDFSEETSGAVYTALLTEVSGKRNLQASGAPNSVGPAGTLPPPPQECVGKNPSDADLPESCKMWFKLQN